MRTAWQQSFEYKAFSDKISEFQFRDHLSFQFQNWFQEHRLVPIPSSLHSNSEDGSNSEHLHIYYIIPIPNGSKLGKWHKKHYFYIEIRFWHRVFFLCQFWHYVFQFVTILTTWLVNQVICWRDMMTCQFWWRGMLI